ncbi:hypothetical protein MTX26_29640 [Bradyrhizobium sp. ISRA443]|uniref:hypothetical protein n=1 Tax=unclassified Bradyrhizobium TaxID=2631580 RepID=UPI0024787C9E|nr:MULTISPECIES: hypothetical protein [unclassified Bradyrhizobium]WGR96314.1 hypothetical protein MTX20_04590 [Bradyrhizobium sp. ISRA435]WGS02952.1 hypothetical protein MTX23_29625 [Bradyrhizobium sp. ISRA436]WGS09839.1 hypothetical protein MTX18_29645 [Bradyrhizobium sp. ISRA437]WGS16725.1 hypothetical protein MTX26_29640 [Bradyrhizobium sp. ISRA443]
MSAKQARRGFSAQPPENVSIPPREKSPAKVPHFQFAFVFACDLIQSESKTVKAKTVSGGSVRWIEFTTSPSSEAALMAAASRAMRRAGATLFSFVK